MERSRMKQIFWCGLTSLLYSAPSNKYLLGRRPAAVRSSPCMLAGGSAAGRWSSWRRAVVAFVMRR